MDLLSQNFDSKGYLHRFASKGRIRCEGLISSEDARATHFGLEQQTPWELQFVTKDGKPDVLTRKQLNSLPAAAIQTLLQDSAERAQSGLSYLRLGRDVYATEVSALKPLTDLIKSSEFARFCTEMTGLTGLALSHLVATCYRPGDFFTQHTDAKARLCFEWNFTDSWRSDWGGLVLFHSPSGDVEGGIMPRMNDLALFSGDQPRSISALAAYANGPRFSVAGRFA